MENIFHAFTTNVLAILWSRTANTRMSQQLRQH